MARAATPRLDNLDFSEAGKVKIPIKSVTNTQYTSLSLKLSFKDAAGNNVVELTINYTGNIGSNKVLLADTAYGQVYAQVYDGTLTLEYLPAVGISIPTTSESVYAYIYETVYQSIYLDLRFRPPTPSGTTPSGGGTPAPTTVNTDTGTITVEGDKATLALDTGKVCEAPDKTKGDTLEIRPPEQVKAAHYEVEIPSDLLAKPECKGKGLAFVTGEAAITLPPGSVDLGEVRKLAADAKVKMVVQKVGETEARELLKAAASGQAPAGDVFEFDLKAVAGSGSQAREQGIPLSRPVLVAAAFNSAKVGDGDRSRLGLYRHEGKAWAYRKSWVKPGADQVVGQLYSFSKYTVMAYRKRFTDTASHWAYADVDVMASKHVVKGVSATAFNPDGKVTRAEFAAMVVRALGLPEAPDAATFSDVPAGAWYAGVVGAAAKAGVVTGMGDGTFRPNDRISREQMAVMVARALKAAGKSVSPERVSAILAGFSDRGRISAWAREGVAAAADAGVVKGLPNGSFAPKAEATRAEAAAMLKRYLGAVGQL